MPTLRLLSTSIPLPAPGTGEPQAETQRRLHELAAGTGYRISVIALDGTVIADSERSLEQVRDMDNHLARPEVADALKKSGHWQDKAGAKK